MTDNLHGSTENFVNKLLDTQNKDEKNRRTQGRKHPERKLPNKRH